jgi:agmatine/peptidylarginine deiminase
MKKYYILFSLLLVSIAVFAQRPLPIQLTPTEIAALVNYQRPNYPRSVFTSPPNAAVRTMAEWEEIQALTITWTGYPSVLREIVRHAKEEAEVIIICNDSMTVKNYLSTYNITSDNISFIEESYNTIWMRDYGQHSVYLNDVDSLLLVDWIYNRPRPADDVIPIWIANKIGLDLYATTQNPTDLVNTGGNFMSDGLGTAFASELILDENDAGNPYGVSVKSAAQIDTIMKNFMGIEPYIKMTVLPYDGINHIDMHMKLLDEETILIGEYPQGIADGPQIETNINYIKNNYTSAFGTPYRFVKVQMPPDATNRYPDQGGDYITYTNSVFVNKTILVPIYNPINDAAALEIYRQNLPGYKVIGINCNSIIQLGGALHCITKAVGVNDPLRIVHQPIRDTIAVTGNHQIDALIQHRSGISNANIYYTADTTQGYQTTPMTLASGDTWQGFIPTQSGGAEVFYYIEATANSGKTQNRPMPAPQGFWNFWIDQSVATEQPQNLTIAMAKVFPNPATYEVFIPIVIEKPIIATIQLFDITGRMVLNIFEGKIFSNYNESIDVSELSKGIYFLSLQTEEGIQTQKIIVE